MQPVSIAILTVKTREDHMEFKLGAHVENERHPFVKVIHPIHVTGPLDDREQKKKRPQAAFQFV
jgi:hypothetical protein